jgi:uncharacterized membrane protein
MLPEKKTKTNIGVGIGTCLQLAGFIVSKAEPGDSVVSFVLILVSLPCSSQPTQSGEVISTPQHRSSRFVRGVASRYQLAESSFWICSGRRSLAWV